MSAGVRRSDHEATVTPVGQSGDVGTLGGALGGSPGRGVSATLEELHVRLDQHYRGLRAVRDTNNAGQPIFALEHGLVGGDLTVLSDAVRSWVRTTAPSARFWLPFVAYAAEIGYRYVGDDYWPTLEANTPGWERHADRHYVSRRFRDFARTYGGAVPKGRWASHFTIICWPITHAVLPTDLQRQLARLLYDYRGALTADILAQPSALGASLAAHAAYASKRFQQFAENTELLGQVAVALLAGGEDDASMLLDSTLHRIVEDLSGEREARRWLSDAKQSADRVRLSGMAPARVSATGTTSASTSPVARATAPVALAVYPTGAGWQLRLRVPDFTPLFVRHPDLPETLASMRCRVAGFGGPPRPRGWLRYAGQELALDRWPGSDAALFDLERADERLNALLGDEARTPPSAPWLFRIGPDGTGRLVRSRAVRPGSTYVLLGPDVAEPALAWVVSAPSACSEAGAVEFTVPETVEPQDRDGLHALGCAAVTAVAIEPVGLVPAAWDGESYGEWIVGDSPLLMLSTSHALSACTMALDEAEIVAVPWHELPDGRALVQLTDLAVGWHHLRISFLAADDNAVPDGHLDVRVREPVVGGGSGTYRDPLQILVSPATASLEDLWEGRATLGLIGPVGSSARVTVRLASAAGEVGRHEFGPVALPLDGTEWRATFAANIRGRSEMQRAYDEAMSAVVEVADAEFGSVSVSVERAAAPLRWGFRRADGQPVLRLHEYADLGIEPVVKSYSFADPDVAEQAVPDHDGFYRRIDGGLLVATLDTYVARAVLPRRVHDFHDLRRLAVTPRLREQPKSPAGVSALMQTAERWSMATVPGDPFAEAAREAVRAVVAAEICSLIGGGLWAALERRRSVVPLKDLEAGLARPGQWGQFRQRLLQLAHEADCMVPAEITDAFAKVIGPAPTMRPLTPGLIVSSSARGRLDGRPGGRFTVAGRWLAEYLLRLASEPGSVREWAGESNMSILPQMIETPIVLRAARMLVLARDRDLEAWAWD